MFTRFSKTLFSAALVAGTMLTATPAFAQATRTWVSGVGDDVNPCSRTAPCKTFAGAISKTAAGGEINCLDPAGYGAVTINKSLVIDCHFTEGGVLAAGNGIVVNAAATDVVVLRGLDIFGVNPPTHGVRILSAAAVHIEDSVIRRFNLTNSFGVSFQPTVATTLYITNTIISQNGTGGTGGGINVQPTGGTGSAKVVLRNVGVNGNFGVGMTIDGSTAAAAGIQVVANESQFVGNSSNGYASGGSGVAATSLLTNDVFAQNGGTGITVSGNASTVLVSNSSITGNAIGVAETGGSVISSYVDNRLEGNPNFVSPNNGTFNGTSTKK
jgi:hypothetical protein